MNVIIEQLAVNFELMVFPSKQSIIATHNLIVFNRASNGGKTMLAEKLQDHFSPVTIIHQDDFYKVFVRMLRMN